MENQGFGILEPGSTRFMLKHKLNIVSCIAVANGLWCPALLIHIVFLFVFFRPDDVLWRRSHDNSVLLHCVLWPMVSLLLGTLIVLLTMCARSLAVRAEALQKRKCSYEVCQDLSLRPSDHHGTRTEDLLSTNSDPELSSLTRTLPLFAVPVRRRDREHWSKVEKR